MNNPGIPDWSFEFDPPSTNPKKNIGRQDHDLVELLWQNGQVVMQSQNNRKPSSPGRRDATVRQPYRSQDPSARPEGSSLEVNLIQDDEMASWIHYPVEDSFDKEFCSNFFGELPTSNPMDVDRPLKQADHEKAVSLGPFASGSQLLHSRTGAVQEVPVGQLPPPRFQFPDPARPACNSISQGVSGKIVNFSQFAPPLKSEAMPPHFQIGQQGSGVMMKVDVREGSVMTVGSSRCGSNQIPNDRQDLSRASSNGVGTAGCISAGIVKEDDCHVLSMSQTEGRKTETLEPTITSSSGGSGSSFGATTKQHPDSSMSHKRKGRGEESECQSQAIEIETANGKKPTQRSGGSTRRSRAAEVHNLSERRRRDRINKKMKALQELIPHCNKTDKASMLDEAIEYLKSLQLQLQVMWMGGGMTPMMIPGAQHYMSPMGLTMCPPGLPAIHPNMPLPRMPVVDQSFPMAPTNNQAMFGQAPVLNPLNFPNQMANHPSFPEQFARYMSMHNMQAPPQGGAQQQQTLPLPNGSTSSVPAYTGCATANGSSGSKIG